MNNKRFKKILAAGVALVTSLSLVACSSGNSAKPASSRDVGEINGETLRVWLMEGSFTDGTVKYLEDQFAKKYPGNKLKVELQPWDGIVQKLQTSLASDSESPDLVETGNTQTSTFSSVGAFAPLTDLYDEVGGKDLIPSFIEAGSWNDTLYSLPLYAGARGVFYRSDLFEEAGIDKPTTLDDLAQAAIDLGAANPDGVGGFSGMYLAAVDIHAPESIFFAGGGEWAVQEGDKWVQKLSEPQSVEALKRVKKIFSDGTAYALDSQASQKAFEKYFNEEKVGMLLGTGNIGAKIDQKLWDEGKVAVMPIPGVKDGELGATFAGGSHISLSANAKNPELAKEALKLIFSEDFQNQIAKEGWVPGNTTYSGAATGPFAEIAAQIVDVSKLTPNTPQWGVASGNNVVRDFWTALAQEDDVQAVADRYGQQLEDILNSK